MDDSLQELGWQGKEGNGVVVSSKFQVTTLRNYIRTLQEPDQQDEEIPLGA